MVMECNKEEAIRAAGIAEKKMESRDFFAAKKFASRAQRLYPDLGNVTQMVSVCDVHCAAESKVYGNEKDWYGILNVEPTADDALIRKQYRKLALLLHPDKNKFPGATDAFTLIGEAQRVLLDREKRTLFNSRRVPSATSQVPMPPKENEFKNQKGPQSGDPNNQPTFWTVCPFCSVRYKYYKTLLNKTLLCRNCKKPYTGHELNSSDARAASKKDDAIREVHVKAAYMSSANNLKKVADETLARPEIPSKVRQQSNSNGNTGNRYEKMSKEGISGHKKKNTKRKKMSAESSETSDSSTSIESDDSLNSEVSSQLPQHKQQRSTRSRRHGAYSENLSDEDREYNPRKRSKGVPFTEEFEVQKEKLDSLSSEESLPTAEQEATGANESVATPEKGCGQTTFDLPSDTGPSTVNESDIFEYPNTDFSDFEKGREDTCFKVGQVWALYDTLDAMPRFYAVITKVFRPAFKVCITWLESDPQDEDGTSWVSMGLPASCGRFRLGNSDYLEDRPSFSHLVFARIPSNRSALKIFPREGETWAIFKDWDMKWSSSHLDSKKKYSYEFVEVLSDYADDIGVCVAYLGKVKGFTSLFHQAAAAKLGEAGLFRIPANEMYRFAHRVPSFRMTGTERNDVPEGSYELDPASLPIEGFLSPQGGVEVKPKSEGETSLRSRVNSGNNWFDSANYAESSGAPVVANKIPEPEFCKFDADRPLEKFQVGQFWAIYGDEDAMPRYYGQIKKMDPAPDFSLHVAWLYGIQPPKGIIRWHDKSMPIGCGMFKFGCGKLHKYTDTDSFSHQVGAGRTDKKGVYKIFLGKGEVWAVYKNWSPRLKYIKLEDCEYEIVEIVDVTDKHISVKFLVKVSGFKFVYKPRDVNGTLKIPVEEQLRFSHQIPAFRLTEERGGSLRGFMELDPQAIPLHLLCTD